MYTYTYIFIYIYILRGVRLKPTQRMYFRGWNPIIWAWKQSSTGARGTWQNQHFQQQRAMDSWALAVFCEHRYSVKMATRCHEEDGRQNTLSMVFAGDSASAPHHFQTFLFEKNCIYPQFFNSVASSWNKSLSTLFFLQTYWYAWLNNCGLDRPLMRVFTRPQKEPLHHVHSLSTPMSLHVHEPKANRSTHVPPQVHSVSTPMSLQWRWTMKSVLSRTLSPPDPPRPTPTVSTPMSLQWRWTMKSVLSRTLSPPRTPPTNTHRINTYVTSMKMNHEERTIKNVITPPNPPTNTHRINTYVTSMKMNHEERTIKNVITPPPPDQHPAYQHLCHFNEDEPWRAYYQERYHPPNPPDQHPPYQHLCHFNEDEPWRAYYQERYHPPDPPRPTPTVSTPMSLQWRWTMKSVLSRTLSPPHPPTNTQRINTYVTSMKMNHRGPGRTSPCHKSTVNNIFM